MDLKFIAKYIHGSEDSTDVDVHYVVEEQPSFQEAKAFCDADLTENRNIITIKDGVVTDCYKGTPDEINNALFVTYKLHEQAYPLLVTRRVERNKPLKYIRAIRVILSHLSRSQYRPDVKLALRSDWKTRLDTLDKIDLAMIDFSTLNKNLSDKDVLKVIAFQLGQCLWLHNDNEVYTKSDICYCYKYGELRPFLYREDGTDLHILNSIMHDFIQILKREYKTNDLTVDGKNYVWFLEENKKFDLKTEKEVNYTVGKREYKILKIDLYRDIQDLYHISQRNDVFLLCYDVKIDEKQFMDVPQRFIVYVPSELCKNELKEFYEKHMDDCYEIGDDSISRLIKFTKIYRKYIHYLYDIHNKYVSTTKRFFDELNKME